MRNDDTKLYHDVVIMGGGLAGATLARQLRVEQPRLSIAVIESNSYPLPEASFKVGESTVDMAGHYLRNVLKLSDYLDEVQLPKYGLRFFLPDGDNSDISTRVEIGNHFRPPSKSQQIDRGMFENDMRKFLIDDDVCFFDATKIIDFDLCEEEKKVFCQNDDGEFTLSSRWLVDASGMSQLIKKKLNLKKSVDSAHFSAWFRLDKPLHINSLSKQESWWARVPEVARRLCTNHLLGQGYWIWIIPLPNDCTSVGIVADPEYHSLKDMSRYEVACEWLQKFEPQLASALDELGAKVMDFKKFSKFTYSCTQLYSPDRWAITGIAGTFTDPFYSPGTDFIAIANTQICDLIQADMQGRSIESKVKMAEAGFFSGFDLLLNTVRNQYGIFGHPLAMTCKVIWDATTAWSGVGPIFCQDHFRNENVFAALEEDLFVIGQLHAIMQQSFRRWSTMSFGIETRRDIIVDREECFMTRLQASLNQPSSEGEIIAQVKRNRARLEALALELFSLMEGLEPEATPIALLIAGPQERDIVRQDLSRLLFRVASDDTAFTAARTEAKSIKTDGALVSLN